jgi:exodeoxyribonuclease-5
LRTNLAKKTNYIFYFYLIIAGMLDNYIASKLLDNLEFQPTPSQEELIGSLAAFIGSDDLREVMLIRGYAGTGKTTLVNSMVRTLHGMKQRVVLLAPTGRAAKVLNAYTGYPAWTIHKKIYRQKSGSDGLGSFVLDRNLHKDTMFIIDEASMIGNKTGESMFGTGNLLSDLIHYVESGTNCRLVLIGDTAQLPPVGLDVSPALDRRVLESFSYTVRESTLVEIVRQAAGSGILQNATAIRQHITSDRIRIPQLAVPPEADISRIGGAELLDLLGESYDTAGEEQTIVVTRSNKRANRFNAGIRSQILWKEEQIGRGDLLMVVKNNYFWKDEEKKLDFIANGDIGRIQRVIGFEELYGLKFATVELSFIDYDDARVEARILLDVLDVDGPALPQDIHRNLYASIMEEHPELTNRKKRAEYISTDPYFNALQVKFAYAVTCHKAQGGQWKNVFLDQGYFTEDMISRDYLRWLYTGFTRATEKLYLVNFSDLFFPPS